MAQLISKVVLILTLVTIIVEANKIDMNSSISGVPKIKLSVYYESLCPYCKQFHLDQLKPAYKLLGDYIDLDLIPFGNAKFVRPDKMECQHGEKECDGNRLMGCVQKYGKKYTRDILATLECLFNIPDDENYCVRAYLPAANYDTIIKCKESNESLDMMKEFYKRSRHIKYVPWIEVNGKHSDDLQKSCQKDLVSCLCDSFPRDTKPAACK